MRNRQLGLGRLPAPDPRDHRFLLQRPAEPSRRTSRFWNDNGWWGNQGRTSMCVGFAWAHWLEDGPVTRKGPAPMLAPSVIYREAQERDEWPGEEPVYQGTSVRAGAKALQARGLIGEYRWAFDLDTLIQTLLEVGPVVLGTNWYTAMFDPDSSGRIHIGGINEGGHGYELTGVSTTRRLFRKKGSWGRDEWGVNGRAWIGFDDQERLIAESGEVCLATEIPDAARVGEPTP